MLTVKCFGVGGTNKQQTKTINSFKHQGKSRSLDLTPRHEQKTRTRDYLRKRVRTGTPHLQLQFSENNRLE